MKIIKTLIAFLIVFLVHQLAMSQSKATSSSGAPVPLFYGLNESQSNDWTQIDAYGNIGMALFDHSDIQTGEGFLICKTISPDGTELLDTVVSGKHLELSVLLFDKQNKPHIFYGESSSAHQKIFHAFRGPDQWQIEEIIDFEASEGKFIYECSAEMDPHGSFHLLLLLLRSNPDSPDYYYAFRDAHLVYLTNASGFWQKELISVYDTYYTLDEYSKMLNRQDLAVDQEGHAHIVFGEQLGNTMAGSASILHYATNGSGSWITETVADCDPNGRDDAGWYPSLCLDNSGNPAVACAYIARVPTGSAMNAKLWLHTRVSDNQWKSEMICESDDGYYGTDGRRYTGGLTHLLFDRQNNPHVIFTDIASSHAGMNYFNLGNIRYAKKVSGSWQIEKIYQQALPEGNYNAHEIYDMCLLADYANNKLHIIAQEILMENALDYEFNLLHFETDQLLSTIPENRASKSVQIVPNPVGRELWLEAALIDSEKAIISIYDFKGRKVWAQDDYLLHPGRNPIRGVANLLKKGAYILDVKIHQDVARQAFLKNLGHAK